MAKEILSNHSRYVEECWIQRRSQGPWRWCSRHRPHPGMLLKYQSPSSYILTHLYLHISRSTLLPSKEDVPTELTVVSTHTWPPHATSRSCWVSTKSPLPVQPNLDQRRFPKRNSRRPKWWPLNLADSNKSVQDTRPLVPLINTSYFR